MPNSIRGRGPWHDEEPAPDPIRQLACAVVLQGVRDARNPNLVGARLWLMAGEGGRLLTALNIDKAAVLNVVDRAREERRARSQPGSRKAEGSPP